MEPLFAIVPEKQGGYSTSAGRQQHVKYLGSFLQKFPCNDEVNSPLTFVSLKVVDLHACTINRPQVKGLNDITSAFEPKRFHFG